MFGTRRPAVLAGLVAGLLITTMSASPVAAVDEPSSPATAYSWNAFQATNDQRRDHGRVVLRGHGCLHDYARMQARRMARQQRIFHQDLGPVLRNCGMRLAGENVAVGFPNGRSVVNDGWMNSEGHRENILRREYRRMGIVARQGEDDRWYVAQVFGRRA